MPARPWLKWNDLGDFVIAKANLRAQPAALAPGGLERSQSYLVPVFFKICSA